MDSNSSSKIDFSNFYAKGSRTRRSGSESKPARRRFNDAMIVAGLAAAAFGAVVFLYLFSGQAAKKPPQFSDSVAPQSEGGI